MLELSRGTVLRLLFDSMFETLLAKVKCVMSQIWLQNDYRHASTTKKLRFASKNNSNFVANTTCPGEHATLEPMNEK